MRLALVYTYHVFNHTSIYKLSHPYSLTQLSVPLYDNMLEQDRASFLVESASAGGATISDEVPKYEVRPLVLRDASLLREMKNIGSCSACMYLPATTSGFFPTCSNDGILTFSVHVLLIYSIFIPKTNTTGICFNL